MKKIEYKAPELEIIKLCNKIALLGGSNDESYPDPNDPKDP